MLDQYLSFIYSTEVRRDYLVAQMSSTSEATSWSLLDHYWRGNHRFLEHLQKYLVPHLSGEYPATPPEAKILAKTLTTNFLRSAFSYHHSELLTKYWKNFKDNNDLIQPWKSKCWKSNLTDATSFTHISQTKMFIQKIKLKILDFNFLLYRRQL